MNPQPGKFRFFFRELKKFVTKSFLSKSVLLSPVPTITKRIKEKISRDPTTTHFTLKKIIKGTLGFIPVALFAHWMGYKFSQKANFNDFIIHFRSEDQIYSVVDTGKPVLTFMYLPGDPFSEAFQAGFHQAAIDYSHIVSFMKINCAEHGSFCRKRSVKYFPWVEIYIPSAPNPSFYDKMMQRLLKGDGKYIICPFRSNFSYEGVEAALKELYLIPKKDPYSDIKIKLRLGLEERSNEISK